MPNGEYDEPDVFEYFNSYENPELIGCERVIRYTKASFVVFAKASTYNDIPSTTDGRHNRGNAAEFRKYISKMIEAVDQLKAENQETHEDIF